MIISTSGYYATGSSAAFNLLEEYSSLDPGMFKGGDYEHVVFYTPDGLFDLEDKLLIGNSIHRSDEAIRSFINKMELLNNNNFDWFGGYASLFGNEFKSNYEEFVNSLVDFKVSGHWHNHYGGLSYNPHRIIGDLKRKALHEKIPLSFGKKIIYNADDNILYSFKTPEEFYKAGKKFVYNYFNMLKEDQNKNLLVNHVLLPQNLFRLPNYFDEDFRVVVVDRDPRDTFIHIHNRVGHRIPYDVESFVLFWKKFRETEKRIVDERIIRIRLEDLIYKYEETVGLIENKCKLRKEDHIRPQTAFNPAISIKNTQMFKENQNYTSEIQYIEQHLPEYLYDYESVDKGAVL